VHVIGSDAVTCYWIFKQNVPVYPFVNATLQYNKYSGWILRKFARVYCHVRQELVMTSHASRSPRHIRSVMNAHATEATFTTKLVTATSTK